MTRDDVVRETVKHVRRVGNLMLDITEQLQRRAMSHDDSKFSEQEFPAFAEETPKLKGLTYGSDEYKSATRRLGPALKHHYAHNRHHPEFHPDGIKGMDLLDLIEMLADWKAATERHEDGDLSRSIEFNADRYEYSDELTILLRRTANNLGWITSAEVNQ